MEINVLGTEYEIILDVKESDDRNLVNNDGYIDYQTKKIVIAQMEDEPGQTDDIKTYWKSVVRHELVHAFLYESGLPEYATDETLVNYLALQMPKMSKLFEELEV